MQQQPSGPLPLRIESAAYQGTYDLTRFTLADMVRCGGALRHLAAESASMEEAAQKVTQFLYKHLLDRTSNDRECVLVRFFKSHSYGGLSNELRQFADSIAERAELPADTKCLVLLGTTGDEARWNSRRMSVAHQAIPLTSEAVVEQSPMIVHLIHQLGLTTAGLLHATPPMIGIWSGRATEFFMLRRRPTVRTCPRRRTSWCLTGSCRCSDSAVFCQTAICLR